MRWMMVASFLAVLAGPVAAQEPCAGEECPRRLDGLLDDLLERVDPLLEQVNPWFSDLADMLGDLSGWHAPEVLPNGDILIRRRQSEPSSPEDAPGDQPLEDDGPVTDPLEL
ncbi:MAG: hypothetical protein Kow0013_20180 [Pararhodobacter sp.]